MWGPQLKRLQEIADKTGVEPEALITYPRVPEPYKEYCDAFMILSSRRSVGMGLNPISLTDILAYIQLYGEPVFGISAFVDMMIKMDAKYLELRMKSK